MLEKTIALLKKEKDILLMTHIVLGSPSFEESYRIVETMVEAGVDLMELQIPFSDPVADGPVILAANQEALAHGSTVERCLEFGRKVAADFPIPFLFMTYCNILYKRGFTAFAEEMVGAGIRGAIVPDLPPEEGEDYLKAMESFGLDPIFIYTPTTSDERMRYIDSFAKGFIYCVARKGITGTETDFSGTISAYLGRCRAATTLPLAVGFGVKDKGDIDFLRGKADIAVIGTQSIRVYREEGLSALEAFLKGIR
jgi:tryptophan synthase alpha chain